jgi:benzodiazapine receptor
MNEVASKSQLWWAFSRWAVVTIPFVLLLGFASARLAPSGGQNPWFAALAKPAFMPSDGVFVAVWVLLYVLIGLAAAMVINARGSRLRGAGLGLFLVQFLLTLTWSPLFFGMHKVALALVVIAAVLVLAAVTTWLFWRVRSGAGALMLPYVAWLAFALLLVVEINRLNPDAETLVPSAGSTQILL